MFLVIETIVISFLLFFSNKHKNIYYSEQVELTQKIKVPKPVGQGQYGTGWWLNKADYNKIFKCNVIDRSKPYNKNSFNSGGIITHFERDGNLEKVYYIDDNIHTLLVGSSGSGKSRSIIIPSITMLGLAGENMFISDVKGELYLYTANKLKELGYDVIAIDYINFLKSNWYNYLDIVIDAVEKDDIPLAESLINDMVSILVENNEKTEPIWKNGEMSVIKTALIAVILITVSFSIIDIPKHYYGTTVEIVGTEETQTTIAEIKDKDCQGRETVKIDGKWYVVTDTNMKIGALTEKDSLDNVTTIGFYDTGNVVENVSFLRLFSESQGTFKGYFANIEYYRDQDGLIFPREYTYSEYQRLKSGSFGGGGGSAGFR